jgi:hypothetical protein
MTSFLYRAPAGVVGDVTRRQDTNIEAGILNPAKAPTAFGVPVKLVSGKFEAIESGDEATDFAGIITRVAPAINGSLNETFEGASPWVEQVQGIAVEGYVAVKCAIGTPVRGGAVFMRVTAATGKLVGDLEATADGANNVELVGVVWAVDGKDASGTSEIRIK